MLEIALLIAATAGIAAFARGRGGKPWLWGTLTVVGYFLVPFLVRSLALKLGANPLDIGQYGQLLFFISAVSWIAIIAFCAASFWAAAMKSRVACGPAPTADT